MFTFAEFINEKYSQLDATTSYSKLLKRAGGLQKNQKAAVNEILAFIAAQIPHLGTQARKEAESFLNVISKFK